MTSPFVLRPLGVLDLDLAAHLHREAFAELGERGWTHQEIAELLAVPGVAGVLLERDGKAIGFALCRMAADEAELLTIAVHPAYRRQGVGRTLLKAVIDLVCQRGGRSLFLEVGVDNPNARALYDRAGFQPVGRRPAYYHRAEGPAADAVVMRLGLERSEIRRDG